MGKFNWKDAVSAVAPVLATTLGGPLAGAAVKTISEAVLGKSNGSETEIEVALKNASPELLAQLKQADQQFAEHMATLGVDLERIAHHDRVSARELAKADIWTPRVLAGVVMAGFFACVGFVLAGKVNVSGEVGVLVGTMIGYASAKADQVVSFYFGSTANSAEKTRLLAKADSIKV